MSSRTSLPQELVDIAIDHLHDDVSALKQCSLVCRDWLSSASHHLFASFEWPPRKAWASRDHTEAIECLTQVTNVLSASPRVAHAVRKLLFRNVLDVLKPNVPNYALTPRTMFAILDLLPNLRDFCTYGSSLCVETPLIHMDVPHTRFVQRLEIISYSTVDHLPHFLRLFRHAHTLVIAFTPLSWHHGHHIRIGEAVEPVVSGALEANSLEIRECCSAGTLFKLLNGILNFESVRRLDLASPPTKDNVPFIQAMRSLDFLAYKVSDADAPPTFALPRVPAVQLACFFHPEKDEFDDDVEWRNMMQHLETFVGPHIRELDVNLYFGDDAEEASDEDVEFWVSGLDWGWLARLAERCLTLTTLRIGIGRGRVTHLTSPLSRYTRVVRAAASQQLPQTLKDKIQINELK